MHLKQLHISEFIKPTENAEAYPEMPGAFKICMICNSEDPKDSTFLQNLKRLDAKDRKVVRAGLSKLLKIANKGEPLRAHYDTKQLHDMHTFTHKGKERTILRIRTGDTRLVFLHADDKLILLLDSFAKHDDAVTEQQRSYAETTAKSYLDADQVNFIQEDQ